MIKVLYEKCLYRTGSLSGDGGSVDKMWRTGVGGRWRGDEYLYPQYPKDRGRRSEKRGSQELIGQPNLEGKFSVQWETLSQGKEAESNRERHKTPCSDLHMHAHMQSPAHSHVCPVEHTHTHTPTEARGFWAWGHPGLHSKTLPHNKTTTRERKHLV